jgi:hypothetical protein
MIMIIILDVEKSKAIALSLKSSNKTIGNKIIKILEKILDLLEFQQ